MFELTRRALTPTHHALQHALAALLAYMRARLVDPEPPLEEIADLGAVLCDVVCWVHFHYFPH
jgi:hypothetical protein